MKLSRRVTPKQELFLNEVVTLYFNGYSLEQAMEKTLIKVPQQHKTKIRKWFLNNKEMNNSGFDNIIKK